MRAKAKSAGTADVRLNGQIVSTFTVGKIDTAQVHSDSSDLAFDISKGKKTKQIKLRLGPNDIKPVYSHEGRQIINQNVNLECKSDHEFVKAVGVKTADNFFCELTYTGPARASQNHQPSIARVDVIAGGRIGGDIYSNQVLTFDVELYSKIELQGSSKVPFSFNNRNKLVKVVSLADIDIDGCQDNVEVLSKSRNIYQPHQFDIRLRYRESVNETCSCDLNIRSKADSVTLKLSYNHETRDVYDALEEYAEEATIQAQQSLTSRQD